MISLELLSVFSSWWAIKTLEASQNPSDFIELEHLKSQMTKQQCTLIINRMVLCVGMDLVNVNVKRAFTRACVAVFCIVFNEMINYECNVSFLMLLVVIVWFLNYEYQGHRNVTCCMYSVWILAFPLKQLNLTVKYLIGPWELLAVYARFAPPPH